jgi:oxygen-independent coproporphyrinogen-3 oxidase
VALFGYAHVPWMKRHQRLIDEVALPGPKERLRQFAAASEALVGGGMRVIGLDHFAAPWDGLARAAEAGRLRRNFQGYTDDKADALIGFGASAISTLPQGFAQNAGGVREWRAAIDGGDLAVTKGLALDDDDRLRAEVIERLMCDLAVDLETVCARHGRAADCLAPSLASLAPLIDDGLVEISGNRVRVPERGRPFLRLACAAFDAYLNPGEERHARAV